MILAGGRRGVFLVLGGVMSSDVYCMGGAVVVDVRGMFDGDNVGG